MADTPDEINLSPDGFSMPTLEVLTGRGFVTGKSGSGKSNTVSVMAEELLAAEVPLLIVDTDGEYYGLKEEYELLHVGGGDHCDLQVRPGDADRLASVALERGVPMILDISGFRDPDIGRDLVGAVVGELFAREKRAKTPFLVIVEEAHEFIPEGGGRDEVGETLIRVAKRGRKRGLGVCALSQRPASVSKDYITQCDWLVWHRLTWENDTKVVARVLGADAAADVEELADGEAVVMTDWDGVVQRVTFRRKHTFDAGATPGLDSIDRPELKSVDGDLLADLAEAVGAEEGAGTESDTGEGGDAEGATAPAPTAGDTDEPATGGGRNGAARASTGTAAADGGEHAGRVGDPAWELARFLAYLFNGLFAGLGRGVAAARGGGKRAGRWIAARLADTPRSRRRVEAVLPKVALVVLGALLGLGLAALAL
jgi:hypothetical protein